MNVTKSGTLAVADSAEIQVYLKANLAGVFFHWFDI